MRFHGDEALFATYARNAAVYGDWLLSGPLDKPPLSLYAMALSMQFTTVSHLPDGVLTLDPARGEWSARLPGVLAGIVTVALIMSAAHRIGGRRAGWFAGALAALSPQTVAFSATAFTDPLLVMFLTGSLAAALYRRGGWSGLLLAAAFATKQQALFYVPLIVVLNLVVRPHPLTPSPLAWRGGTMRRFLIAFTFGLAALLVWDAARPDPSIFTYAADNNNPYRLFVPPGEWGMRVTHWLVFGATAFGAWPVTLAVVLCSFLPIIGNGHKIYHRGHRVHRARRDRFHLFSVRSVSSVFSVAAFFRLFILAYLAAHIILPFNVYDRYLLLLYPPVIILAARTLAHVTPRALTVPALAAVILLSLTAPARYPTDVRDRNGGVIALADFVNAQGLGTIVYNRWLGWEMGYYLGAWSDKRVVYYPTPQQFAVDAPTNPDSAPRLLIAPAWTDVQLWLNAARDAGFAVRIAFRSADYAAWWLENSERK